MSDWYATARVRNGPVPRFERSPGYAFSPALAPHVLDARVAALGDEVRADLLGRMLQRYLRGTVVLETRIVNPLVLSIAEGSSDDSTRRDAWKLYCDEGWHAVLAADLLGGLRFEMSGDPVFAERLAAHETACPADPIRFLFTVVTETVVSSTLSDLARDTAVMAPVREFVAEHARDEAWHAAFFGARFAEHWASASPADRERVRDLMPRLIDAYLAPDVDAIAADLRRVGVSDVEAVIAEVYSADRVGASIREAARPTLALMARLGVA